MTHTSSVPPNSARRSSTKWSVSSISEADRVALQGYKKWPQHLAAISATLVSLVGGAVLGWASPSLDELQQIQKDQGIGLSEIETQSSWIASLAPLGALVGAALAGWLVSRAGRRSLILSLVVPNVVGWVILVAAGESITLFYVGRMLTGLAVGAATVLVPHYATEIAESSIRGTVGVYLDLSLTVGILLAYVVGGMAGQAVLSGVCGVLSLVAALSFFFMPESPLYLVTKGRKSEAERALCWLRTGSNVPPAKGSTSAALLSRELDGLTRMAEESEERVRTGSISSAPGTASAASDASPTSRAVVLVVILMALQQLSGIDAIIFFLQQIFRESGSVVAPVYSAMIVGAVQVVATLVAAALVERAGRRLLLGVSGSLMAAALAALVVYYLFHKTLKVDLQAFEWLPIACLSAFVFVYCIGFGPLPFLMMAEFLPLEAKSWGSALATCVNWSLMFLVTRVFKSCVGTIGESATFGIFCFICILGTLFVLVIVPETQGKTPAEIRKHLQDKEIHTIARRMSTPGGIGGV